MKIATTCILLAIILVACDYNKTEIKNNKRNNKVRVKNEPINVHEAEDVFKNNELDARINDINQWYAKIIQIQKRNCLFKHRITYDGIVEQHPYKQNAKLCKISNEFELIEANRVGWEWNSTIHLYKRNGKIFYALYDECVEASFLEQRFFCDENENIIRFQERIGSGEPPNGPQITVKLKKNPTNIRNQIGEQIKEIERILKLNI